MNVNCAREFHTLRPIENIWHPALIALLLATIYCLPGLSLFLKLFLFHESIPIDNSGINYALYSDGGLAYTPQLANLAYQLKHFTLQGVDFFTDNGASEFFVRANLIIFYPLAMLLTFLMKASTFKSAALVFFLLVYIHVFLAVFFLNLLGRQFFNLTKPESVFFSTIVVFTYIYAVCIYELSFFMSYTLFPLILYAMLISPFVKKKSGLLLVSFAYFNYIFVGYLPLPLFGILFSLIFCLCYIYIINPDIYPQKRLALQRLIIPLLVACFVAAPGCLAIVKYVSYAGTPALKGLAYAAYSLPEHLRDFVLFLIAEVNHPAAQPGSMLKLSLLCTTIWILFLVLIRKTVFKDDLVHTELFKFSLIFSGLTILISFGNTLHLSTVFYYLIPAFSEMHQYQRYFGFGIVFFAIATTIAFRFILETHPIKLIKIVVLIFFLITIAISIYLTCFNTPQKSPPFITEATLTQYFLLLLLFGSILIFNKTGQWNVAAFFYIITALGTIYPTQITVGDNQNSIVLDKNTEENKQFIAYLKSNSQKKLIKYANLSSNLFTYVPLNYPWVVADSIKLSTYIGYEPHLSQDNAYRAHVHTYGNYEFNWLSRTGADYVIYDQAAYNKFKDFIDTNTEPSIRFPLSNGEIAAKLKASFTSYTPGYSENLFDNGYIVLQHTQESPKISNFSANSSAIRFNVTINDNNSKLVLPFFANRHLLLSLNGKAVPFQKEQDMYYYIFNQGPGEYAVSIDYYYLPLSIFLYFMLIYYSILLITGLFILYTRFFQGQRQIDVSPVEDPSLN